MKKILFIVSSYPPDICGVGDYTSNLVNESSYHSDISCSVYKNKDWRVSNLFKIYQNIVNKKIKNIFMQYPSEGTGRSITPFLLCLLFFFNKKINFNVTLHEFSSFSNIAKFLIVTFFSFSKNIVFTNKFEMECYKKLTFSAKRNVKIIPIGANIPVSPMLKKHNRCYDICYFGHIRPNKGIENFLQFVESLLKFDPNLRWLMIGQIPSGYEDFYNTIRSYNFVSDSNLVINSSDLQVASLLSKTKFAYLPFPDGLTERRGSFLACVINGCVVISNASVKTPDYLNDYFINVNNISGYEIFDDDYFIKKEFLSSSFVEHGHLASWNFILKGFINLL